MNLPAIPEDFPIGCTVRVKRLPRSKRWDYLTRYLYAVGTVVGHIDEDGDLWVDVRIGNIERVFRAWWLECGHSVWVPDGKSFLDALTDQQLSDELLHRMGERARAELEALPDDDFDKIRWLEGRAVLLEKLRT